MFSALSRRRVVALVVLTCLIFITLDRNGNPVINRVRGVLATVLQPIDTATRAITLPLERTWYGITHYDDVERENQALRDQLEHQKGNDVEARSAILEYRLLLKVQQLASKFSYPTVAAQVIGDSPGNFQNTVEINVGSIDGIRVGMPVTNGAGLIGRITRVYPTHSLVKLITDPAYSVPAQVLSADDDEGIAGPLPEIPVGGTTSSSTSTTTTTTTVDVTTTTTSPGETAAPTTATPAATTTTVLEVIRETGLLEGQGGNKPLLLRFVDSSSSLANVKVGSIVDTAGGTKGLAPQGIPIGVITRIVAQSGDSSALVEVTPNASLRQLNFVAVVLYVSETAGP
ncbi:MAG TPA: rod shape-determining protein MreC [Ilumatobacteraceae bacterium]|mgnify:CR=1 FL=1|nr:rod shape-determining protein MreC [Ilumatobacteraceae bacterium]